MAIYQRNPINSGLVDKLIDWLLILLGVTMVLWFLIRLPVFSSMNNNQQAPLVSIDNLKSHVETLVQDYSPRTLEYGNLNITAHYIHQELGNFGEVYYQPYWTLAGRLSNVIISFGPDTEEVFVIGAHYDAESDSLDIEGNASGVATLIELARHLSENESKLAIKVSIVAYPLSQKHKSNIDNMGSYNHAKLLKSQNKKVKLMVSLDGVGHFNDNSKSQKYPYHFMQLFYPSKGDYISLITRLQDYSVVRKFKQSFASSSELSLYSFVAPQEFSPTQSLDHINYQKTGFPAILISDTGNFREAIPDTDIIQLLDYVKMSMLVKGLYRVIMDSESKLDEEIQFVHQEVDGNQTSLQKTTENRGGVL